MKLSFLDRFLGGDPNPETLKIAYNSSLSASNKALFGKLLTAVAQELPDLLAVSVIALKSGELQATRHVTGKSNPAKAAAHYAEVIKQQQQAVEALGPTGEEHIEDVLITLTSQWHVLRLLPGNRHFVHLMMGTRVANLGLAREVLRAQAAAAG